MRVNLIEAGGIAQLCAADLKEHRPILGDDFARGHVA